MSFNGSLSYASISQTAQRDRPVHAAPHGLPRLSTLLSQTWPRGRADDHPRSTKMTFRTAADSGRARKIERGKRERREPTEQKCSSRCNTPRPRRCIDACADIMRSPPAIGRLMPAICGYCCYLTVTPWAPRDAAKMRNAWRGRSVVTR